MLVYREITLLLLGLDGAGKSTVLANLLEGMLVFQLVVLLSLKPSCSRYPHALLAFGIIFTNVTKNRTK